MLTYCILAVRIPGPVSGIVFIGCWFRKIAQRFSQGAGDLFQISNILYMTEGIELTAYCGLYCGDCIRYRSRVSDLARELLSEFRNMEFGKYATTKSSPAKQFDAVKQFEHYAVCCEVLEAIVALQCNSPCRVGGGYATFSCGILECCLKKGFDGCWQCAEFESCQRFEALRAIHGDSPQQNLRTIKKFGLDKWVEHRHKPYVWQ